MDANEILRKELLALLRGGNAHMGFDEAVADFPMELINRKPVNLPYTPWHLLEHMRRVQLDILEFVRDPQYVSPEWPASFWPPRNEQATWEQWEKTLREFRAGLKAVEDMAQDLKADILAELPHAPGYTLFREILLVADHNAYHIGEFGILREVSNTWPVNRGTLAADMAQFPPFL